MIVDPDWLAARRSLVLTDEAKQRLREANARQFADPAARARHAERTKKQWETDRAVLVEAQRIGREAMTPERRKEIGKRVGDAHRGMKRPPETGQRIADAARKRWAAYTPERKAEIVGAVHRAASAAAHGNSQLELTVCHVLDEMGVGYERNVAIGRYTVDILIRDRMLALECDGARWHKGREGHDAHRDSVLAGRGYRVVRLTEVAIQSAQLAAVVELALSYAP